MQVIKRLFGLMLVCALINGCALGGRQFLASETGLPEGAYLSTVRGQAAVRPEGNVLDQDIEGLNDQTRAYGVFENTQVEDYLNSILVDLQRNFPMEKKPAHVYFTPSLDYVPYATSGGGIYLPVAMLANIETEDELAAVIAHEYGHILLDHHRTGFLKQDWFQALPVLATALTEQDDEYVYASLAVTETMHTAIMPAFSRSQERDADLIAIDLLALSGDYNPLALPDFLKKLDSWEKRYRAEEAPPEIDWANLLVAEENEATGETELKIGEQFAQSAMQWLSHKRERLQNTHDSTEERVAAVRQYLREKYRDYPTPDYTRVVWETDRNNVMRDLLAETAAMRDLKSTLAEKGAPRRRVRRSLRRFAAQGRPSAAYGVHLQQLANEHLSNRVGAADALQKSVTYRQPLLEQKLDYVVSAAHRSPEEGAAALKQIESRYGSEKEYLPYKVYFAKINENPIQANVHLLKCTLTFDSAVSDACQKADKGERPF